MVRSFARIHETNLKKQGVLPLTFKNSADYDLVQEDDRIDLIDLQALATGKSVQMALHHRDGSKSQFEIEHTMTEDHISWFKEGSALNKIKKMVR